MKKVVFSYCKFCRSPIEATIDLSGPEPTGQLAQCSCPDAISDRELQDRMESEKRLAKRRLAAKDPLVYSGRTEKRPKRR